MFSDKIADSDKNLLYSVKIMSLDCVHSVTKENPVTNFCFVSKRFRVGAIVTMRDKMFFVT